MAPLQHTDTQSLVTHLRDAVGAERWRVWFEGATDFHVTPEGLTVGVANLFISDYVKSHFSDALARAAMSAFGRPLPVAYRVQPDLFQKRRQQNLADEAEVLQKLGGQTQVATRPQAPPPSAAAATHAAPEARPLFTLDSFVVGPCNQMAYAAARSAAAQPGKDFHPLFIHGGCGLGKTHLLQGILNDLRRHGNRRVACVSAEQFTNQYVQGMRTGGLDAFRHRFRHLDVLAIDDIHFLAGKPGTQEEFLHTFNEFDAAGRLVILASDSHPREIANVQDRLISRWVAGLVVTIQRPDSATRRRILEAKAIHLGRPMPGEVLDLVAERVPGSVRELEGALMRLIAFAALMKHPMTVAMAREALADIGTSTAARLGIAEIEEAVATFFNVSTGDIRSARKSHVISLARQATMVLARELTGLSFADIARSLGDKNHTTVLAACRKWQQLVKDRAEISWTDRHDRRTLTAESLLEVLRERVRR